MESACLPSLTSVLQPRKQDSFLVLLMVASGSALGLLSLMVCPSLLFPTFSDILYPVVFISDDEQPVRM
jgi:hypothetical protein